ncbi:MAG: dihydroorotate dehydrogenase electron transfer subunit, partial [Thermoproteota archaeon]
VRGPFGNSFTIHEGRILTVSGGTGTVPILFLAHKIASQARKVISVIGAKTKDELLFLDEMRKTIKGSGMKVVATTEDGSHGFKGLATDRVENFLAKEEFDFIYTCGPELMMRKVFDWAEDRGIRLEASLERLMRCSIGLCGSCTVGRYRVCRDGPVFNSGQLREISNEFGVSKRGMDGRKMPLT